MIDGSHLLRCSSVPCLTIECRPKMLMCTVEQAANAPAERPTSCIMMAGLGDAESGAAIFRRHRDAEPAAVGDSLGELERERMGAILLGPIVVVEPVANGADRIADFGALRRIGERFHRFGFLSLPLPTAA